MLTSARLVTWRSDVPANPYCANSSSAAPRMRSLALKWVVVMRSRALERSVWMARALGFRWAGTSTRQFETDVSILDSNARLGQLSTGVAAPYGYRVRIRDRSFRTCAKPMFQVRFRGK